MNIFTVKKHTAISIMGLLCSIAYGFFVVASLQRLYLLGSGDINDLVYFFDDFGTWAAFNDFSVRGEGLFRFFIFALVAIFELKTLTILSYIAFIISSISFYIFTINIRSKKYLLYLLPLFLMVFFTPNVANLYASSIRSGIAFTILLIAFIYPNVAIRYILFGLSAFMHLSMIPLISLYFLFHMFRHKRINVSSQSSYIFLILYSFFIAIASFVYRYNITASESSIYYKFLIFGLALLLLFTSKKAIKNIYGFMSIGIILIVVAGNVIDVSFSRYIGNAMILYLLFLVKEANSDIITVFSLGYAPFFALTLYYSITNLL